MPQTRYNLIFKLVIPDTHSYSLAPLSLPGPRTSLARPRGIPHLNHEPLHIAMYQRVVIVATRTQRKKVVRRLFGLFAFDLDLDVAQIGMQRH
jgi:hypothetical protein